jgi:uncharacterized membrane protein YjdF
VAPKLIALPILLATAARFPLTPLAYTLFAVPPRSCASAATTPTPRYRWASGCATLWSRAQPYDRLALARAFGFAEVLEGG